MVRGLHKLIARINFLYDTIVLILAFLLAWYIRFESGLVLGERNLTITHYLPVLSFIIPLALAVNYFSNVYSVQRRRVSEQIVLLVRANFFLVLGIMASLFFFKEVNISRIFLAFFILLNLILGISERVFIKLYLDRLHSQDINQHRILIIGAGSLGIEVASKIQKHRELGYKVIGCLDDDQAKVGTRLGSLSVLGKVSDLEEVAQQNAVDEVITTLPLYAHEKLSHIISTCEHLGLKSMIAPDYFDYIPARPKVEDLEGIPLLNIRHVPLEEPLNNINKRIFDIIFSVGVLLGLSPLYLLISIGVKLSSPGPILYRQERLGMNRKPFQMYKFRSMRLAERGEDQTTWSSQNEARKTKIGAFLRRTSLDELPQFWNVLKGDMSVIGPRPERPFFVEQFKQTVPKYMIKHHVRPGITGWAQVHGLRGDTSIKDRIKHDLYYVENWTFALDLKIIFMTILNGFINKNAY